VGWWCRRRRRYLGGRRRHGRRLHSQLGNWKALPSTVGDELGGDLRSGALSMLFMGVYVDEVVGNCPRGLPQY